jgi:phosphate transport system protein
MFSAVRHLERIADHATNIAEEVVYLVEGELIRHRPLKLE